MNSIITETSSHHKLEKLGEAFLKLNRMEDAKDAFLIVLIKDAINPHALHGLARVAIEKEGLRLDKKAEAHLENYLNFLHRSRNQYFGNARAVRKVVEKAIKNQHLRLAALDAEKRTKRILKGVKAEGVSEFTEGNDSLLVGF